MSLLPKLSRRSRAEVATVITSPGTEGQASSTSAQARERLAPRLPSITQPAVTPNLSPLLPRHWPQPRMTLSCFFAGARRCLRGVDSARRVTPLIRQRRAAQRNVTLHLQLGWTCYYTGKLDEGEAWMRQVVAADPGAWQAHFVLGAIHQARRKLDDALASYARGMELHPGDVQAYVMSGICKLEQGDHECCRSAVQTRNRHR